MCFSAEASFAAGAVLGAGGVWSLSKATEPAERPLSLIPLLFSGQQFAEGVVWVGLGNDQPELASVFSYAFIFFAFLVWPIHVPLAVLRVETDRRRRRVQGALLVVGICVAVFILGSLARNPLQAGLLDGHVDYRMQLPLLYESLGLYFLAVSAPCFSSHRWLQIFGALLVTSLAVSLAIYRVEFISVWCFFAAALSALVLVHFHAREEVVEA